MTDRTKLQNRRCIALVRCSTGKQSKNSFPQQQEWLKTFAEENGMVYVGDRMEARSASQTRKRPDLDYLFKRKDTKDDFDTVLVQDLSRLTRGGLKHGLRLFFKFEDAGIRVVSVIDGVIDDEEKLREACARFQEHRATARASAMVGVRGRLQSRKSGRNSYSARVPFGIDRLITNPQGEPLFVLRNLPDGRQHKLALDRTTILYEYPPNEPDEVRHHVRQFGEKVKLIKGAPEAVEVVRRIYAAYFIRGLGYPSIARELNDEGVPAPTRKLWNRSTVHFLLHNSVYLNRPIGNRKSKALFWKFGDGKPVAVSDAPDEVLGQWRPESEWYVDEQHPDLEDYLPFDPVLKEAIHKRQLEALRRLANRKPSKPGGDRHAGSDFVLKHILRSKEGGCPMTGTTQTQRGKRYRYYHVSTACDKPLSNNKLNGRVNADALEPAILSVISEVLGNYTGAEDATRAAFEAHRRESDATREEVGALKRRRVDLLKQIDFWVRRVSELGEEVVDQQTSAHRNELLALNRKIGAVSYNSTVPPVSAEVISQQAAVVVKQMAESVRSMAPAQVRAVLRTLVNRAEADLETKRVEFDLRLPSWAIQHQGVFAGKLSLDDDLVHKFLNETYGDWTVPLASVVCSRSGNLKHLCYSCRRADMARSAASHAVAA